MLLIYDIFFDKHLLTERYFMRLGGWEVGRLGGWEVGTHVSTDQGNVKLKVSS